MGLKREKMRGFLKRSQEVLEELWPAIVKAGGESYQAAAGEVRTRSEYVPGGELKSREVSIRIRKDLLTSPFPIGTLITHEANGRKEDFRVVERVEGGSEVAWFFRCVSPEER